MSSKVLEILNAKEAYQCWLQYKKIEDGRQYDEYASICLNLAVVGDSVILNSALQELIQAVTSMFDKEPLITNYADPDSSIILGTYQDINLTDYGVDASIMDRLNEEGYLLQTVNNGKRDCLLLVGKSDKGTLYATHHLLRLIQTGEAINDLTIVESPRNQIRMLNQWDNMDGSVERGYSGNSIFFDNNQITTDLERIKDYARLLSSVGINAISINNVNVWQVETNLITSKLLPEVANIADTFRRYGIKTFLSINFASPIELGDLTTADPLDQDVKKWWKDKVKEIYAHIPDFGGFVVKADSEHRPGPFSYDRDHADGSNMLAEALQPFDGIVVWRCFVYNCMQDWRDRSTDRARAAYDHFKPLDGKFHDNVILQVKNGPMDFQVREPISPMIGAMENTNQILEFQIAQEYLGQQKDLAFLIPMWKEVLDFDTYAKGEGSTVTAIVDGSLYDYKFSGIAAVSNIGNDINWTGNTLAQANLYGYGRLIWNPNLTAEEIAGEWVLATFGSDSTVLENITSMLLDSREIYENYTTPLGIGWMVNPNHHYGPNVDGYEYSRWGTYHFADRNGIGVDRTIETGTGYAGQYFSPNKKVYNSLEECPDELLLFFHHVPYTHKLKSGETVIQHYYNTHFKGVEQVENLIVKWTMLEDKIDEFRFNNVLDRLKMQLANAKEWRDQVNTYFYRKSGIADEKNRTIY
ncbi:alpha-glucuronidase family glycosyl hydrolase [Aquibacillus salsiterrae]|uniref:Xylan alpha-1,2-glucuronidase n=1 Tax=Aquibacillus salsiterrae TaxID=2950439 RepID=A0A9X3WDB6_9BACI|nr:alpha-glucuronidase family glycosyl hydrolase [Aquibacillus salsiterrae]MDC3416908.1 alpha-glucuronidase [Aquibacillus salsiterrae]